jgi:hypothetical protein
MSTANTVANNAVRKLNAAAEEKVKRNREVEVKINGAVVQNEAAAVRRNAAIVEAMNGQKVEIPLPPVNNSYKKLAEDSTKTFDSLRDTIKYNGDMFAFGEPTPKMLLLLTKLYHENIMRNLSDKIFDMTQEEAVALALEENPAANTSKVKPKKLRCMFGVLVEKKGGDEEIYVTISESPGLDLQYDGPSDKEYMLKRRMVINLLESANVQVEFPELKEKTKYIGFDKPEIPDAIKWRDSTGRLKQYDNIKKSINLGSNLFKRMMLDSDMSKNTPETFDIYKNIIRSTPMKVNFIDSVQYLARRVIVKRNETGRVSKIVSKPTFRAFKKWKFNSKSGDWLAQCNNGHLCTESKLFAYAAFNGIKASSFVAYWIENKIPPFHYLESYSYRTAEYRTIMRRIKQKEVDAALAQIDNEIEKIQSNNSLTSEEKANKIFSLKEKRTAINNNWVEVSKSLSERRIKIEENLLDNLTQRCLDVIAVKEKNKNSGEITITYKNIFGEIPIPTIQDRYTYLKKYMKDIVEPAAVACPGCFANIQDYKDGKMVQWNTRDCYVTRKKVGGATRRILNKSRIYTHKHKH